MMLKVQERPRFDEELWLPAENADWRGMDADFARNFTGRLLELLESAERSLPRPDGGARRYIHTATLLLRERRGFLPQEPDSERGFRGGMARWQMVRVERYVEANLIRHMTVADIAAQTGFHPSHFSRVFRSVTGESPHRYVVQRRIKRAQDLMLCTERTLSEIAVDCGMADQAHLTRLFRRYVGQTPGCWRRRQKHV